MNFMKLNILSLLITLSFLVSGSHSLDLDSVREGPCVTAKVDPNLNMTWYAGVQWRYFLAGNKFDLYQACTGHPHFDTMREFEFYYYSCFELTDLNIKGGSATINTFGGEAYAKLSGMRFKAPGDFELDIAPLPTPGLKVQVIRHFITLTDNEKFVFYCNCFDEKDRGFSVLSTKPELDKDTMNKIDQHAISLGFRKENIIWLRRENCDLQQQRL